MADKYFLNADHTYRPCELMEWAAQLETMDRRVAHDVINNWCVSTIWLGLNHNYYGGPPLVFETMIFSPDGLENYLARYTTWDQAVAGHQEAIDWVKNGCKEEDK